MRGILKKIVLDRNHVDKHLPNTIKSKALLKREGFVHVFMDRKTLIRVAATIKARGEYRGLIRGHERYGLYFSAPIGYRLNNAGTRVPLFYGEIKIRQGSYHVIPRTRPSS